MPTKDFVAAHELWSAEQVEAAGRVAKLAEEKRLAAVRVSFADQHGMLRGKTLIADDLIRRLRAGVNMTTTLLAKDTSHRTVYPVFTPGGGFAMAEMAGGSDFVMVADPTTFRILPWAEGTGWLLADIYFPNGTPVPFSTRGLYRQLLGRLAEQGYDYLAGLEVEFHVLRLVDPKLGPEHAAQSATPPEVELLAHGFQYLTENRADELSPVLDILRRDLVDLGLPLRTVEVEFGPSQCEMTFDAGLGLAPADMMVLFRSAVKQICRRHGYHATFMCRPHLANLFSSGWHLHQSLVDRQTGANAFMAGAEEAGPLSDLGQHFLAGLLVHAAAASVFTTPTLNGYKRYRPYSLAPDRIGWGRDNRGAMLRVIGGPGDPTSHIENRVGEPMANPYLYMASQIAAGLDGLAHGLRPPDELGAPYAEEAPRLPQNLGEAVAALKASTMYRNAFGDRFVDYLAAIKEAEVARFWSETTDWEQREYFENF